MGFDKVKFRKDGIKKILEYLPPKYAKELEKQIYIYAVKYVKTRDIKYFFTQVYKDKLNNLCYNFNQKVSTFLVINIITNKISLEKLPYMSESELSPEIYKSIVDKMAYVEFQRNNMATTDAYCCRKCNNRKCTSFSIQTRSCDEPTTLFVTCEICKNRFRFN